MRLSMHSILVFVPDLDGAREFYGGILGLDLVRAESGFQIYHGNNFRLVVFLGMTQVPNTKYSQDAGTSIAFSVSDLNEAIAELTAKGVPILHASPNEGPIGRYVAFANPFGTVHELVESVE